MRARYYALECRCAALYGLFAESDTETLALAGCEHIPRRAVIKGCGCLRDELPPALAPQKRCTHSGRGRIFRIRRFIVISALAADGKRADAAAGTV